MLTVTYFVVLGVTPIVVVPAPKSQATFDVVWIVPAKVVANVDMLNDTVGVVTPPADVALPIANTFVAISAKLKFAPVALSHKSCPLLAPPYRENKIIRKFLNL